MILSAPSGAGKTTLGNAVLQRFPDILYSVSCTTRQPRAGEIEGVDYHFISRSDFREGIGAGRWAEWAEVHGHLYGTPAEFLNQGLDAGKDILLIIDVQGARKILDRYPQTLAIFIAPPSKDVLQARLESRGTDSRETIEKRLANAQQEMAAANLYHHIVVNDNLQEAIEKLVSIIKDNRSVEFC